jgi:hypothetical protein
MTNETPEIIPFEPDTDNTGAGKNKLFLKSRFSKKISFSYKFFV